MKWGKRIIPEKPNSKTHSPFFERAFFSQGYFDRRQSINTTALPRLSGSFFRNLRPPLWRPNGGSVGAYAIRAVLVSKKIAPKLTANRRYTRSTWRQDTQWTEHSFNTKHLYKRTAVHCDCKSALYTLFMVTRYIVKRTLLYGETSVYATRYLGLHQIDINNALFFRSKHFETAFYKKFYMSFYEILKLSFKIS